MHVRSSFLCIVGKKCEKNVVIVEFSLSFENSFIKIPTSMTNQHWKSIINYWLSSILASFYVDYAEKWRIKNSNHLSFVEISISHQPHPNHFSTLGLLSLWTFLKHYLTIFLTLNLIVFNNCTTNLYRCTFTIYSC